MQQITNETTAETEAATSIYHCIWMNGQAREAAAFYCSLFGQADILEANPMATTFTISGTKFLALNGGPEYTPSSAISFYVYCGSADVLQSYYSALSAGGTVLMPLGAYDWSPQYTWVIDQYGVNWQLDIDDIRSDQKIVPNMLFANEKRTRVKEALAHYTAIFKDSQVLLEAPHPAQAGLPDGALLFAQFKLDGFLFNAMSSTIHHDFDFSPGTSFVISCGSQAQIDYYWEMLGTDGQYERCGWLTDKFGVSWQIVPAVLSELMADPEKAPRVMNAFMKMQKFDIQQLINA